jgi:hypothetical protein
MMMLLLMAGIGALLGGLVAIAFGIPVKEFSFGNTLIVVGAMGACTGLIMIGLAVVVGELKSIARRLAPRSSAETRPRELFQGATADEDPPDEGNLEPTMPSPSPVFQRARTDAPMAQDPAPEPAPPPSKLQRNLMFAAASRKERERQGRPTDISPPDLAPTPIAGGEPPQPPGFDDGWTKPDRPRGPDRPPLRRGGRPMFTEQSASAAVAPARNADPSTVTVLKSGVVDGMAYSLYSDGSIEAQLPEGTMRFGSIDELRVHLDQR